MSSNLDADIFIIRDLYKDELCEPSAFADLNSKYAKLNLDLSVAISLKRIADSLDKILNTERYIRGEDV